MIHFLNSEFWLSLAFVVILGMVVFSPVRQSIKKFLNHQREVILNQIAQSDAVLKEAQNLYKKTQKETLFKSDVQQVNQQIKAIQREFDEKIKARTEAQRQDFQVRQNMMALHMKNHLRTELLNRAEKKVLKPVSIKSLDKDVNHLIQMLHENKDELKKSLV